jgi:hypothetical protein
MTSPLSPSGAAVGFSIVAPHNVLIVQGAMAIKQSFKLTGEITQYIVFKPAKSIQVILVFSYRDFCLMVLVYCLFVGIFGTLKV